MSRLQKQHGTNVIATDIQVLADSRLGERIRLEVEAHHHSGFQTDHAEYDASSPPRSVTPEQARDIDALAQALDPAPPDRHVAQTILAQFPWAAPPMDAFRA